MNRLVDPQATDVSVVERPGGLRGLILRAQLSPLGYRAMTTHFLLLQKFGALGYSFLAFVVAPTLIVSLYLALWASREYESETRFTVRSGTESAASSISDALAAFSAFGLGTKATSQDAFIVADYVRSRSIIEDLGGKALVHELYSKPNIDFFSRLKKNASFEEIRKYWNSKVSAIIDTQSTIVTVKVQAYSAEEAHRLTDLIAKRSEALVNEISERSRNDALKRAEGEVQVASKRLVAARQNLLDFRNKSSVINPLESASSIGKTLAQLVRDKLALENSRATLSDTIDKSSPTQRMLQSQIESLDKQIAELQERLTSQRNNNVISEQISSFEELQLEIQFAERLLTIAQSAYEKARMEQDRQQLYLVPIVRPTMPEKTSYPRLAVATPMIFIVFLVFWSMIFLVIASIRDHLGY